MKKHAIIPLLTIYMLSLSGCETRQKSTLELTASDISKIQALEKTYVDGWFDDDPQKVVLSAFEDNAAFIPHHGDPAVIGKENIQDFFWPGGTGGIVHYFCNFCDRCKISWT